MIKWLYLYYLASMLGIIKSKRIVFSLKESVSLSFCAFLNQDRILAVFSNSRFAIVNINSCEGSRIVFEDSLNIEGVIIDCKRIKNNVICILSSKLQQISFIKYINDFEVLVGGIEIAEMQFFRDIQVSVQMIPFDEKLFALKCECFQRNITYFAIFRELEKTEFSYDISFITYERAIGQHQIVRALPINCQFVFFRQSCFQMEEWKIKFMNLQGNQGKQIDLFNSLSGQHSIQDIIAKWKDQYLVFVIKTSQEGLGKLVVYQCRIYQTNGQYAQNLTILHTFQTSNGLLLDIVDVNCKEGYFLSRVFAHSIENQQIVDDYLQMRSLQNGKLLDSIKCNLKMLQFSPNCHRIVDYAQSVNSQYDFIIHIRAIFNKKSLFCFLLHAGRNLELKGQLITQILSLL